MFDQLQKIVWAIISFWLTKDACLMCVDSDKSLVCLAWHMLRECLSSSFICSFNHLPVHSYVSSDCCLKTVFTRASGCSLNNKMNVMYIVTLSWCFWSLRNLISTVWSKRIKHLKHMMKKNSNSNAILFCNLWKEVYGVILYRYWSNINSYNNQWRLESFQM